MGSFVDTVGTTTPLAGFDGIGITYLAATNTGWLPYLADEGVKFVHYPANRVKRQFGLDQDIPDDLSLSHGVPHFGKTFFATYRF